MHKIENSAQYDEDPKAPCVFALSQSKCVEYLTYHLEKFNLSINMIDNDNFTDNQREYLTMSFSPWVILSPSFRSAATFIASSTVKCWNDDVGVDASADEDDVDGDDVDASDGGDDRESPD